MKVMKAHTAMKTKAPKKAKAMKAKAPKKAKAMKAMKRKKAMKVSKIAKGSRARAAVFSGGKEKTSTGLSKGDLMKNKNGKIVTKKSHAQGKKAYARIKGWTVAVQQAKKALGLHGFIAVKKGTALYK